MEKVYDIIFYFEGKNFIRHAKIKVFEIIQQFYSKRV